MVGLGWDPVDRTPNDNGKKGFFGRLFGGASSDQRLGTSHDIDCDAFALALRSDNKYHVENLLYFGQKRILNDAVIHSGDNLTGDGDGDDEQITIDLERLPNNITKIVVGVNIYRGRDRMQSFGNIQNAFIRIVDMSDNVELCKYELSSDPSYADSVTVHFGNLIKGSNGWEFEAVGKASNANSIGQFVDNY